MRSPKASEGSGGALGEAEALKRGNSVGVRDQVMDLVSSQGLPVTRKVDLLPTPAVGHIRNHDEPIEDYLGRREDYLQGKTKGMPGASLGVAVRMELFTTPIASEGLKASAAQSSAERSETGQVFLTNEAHDLALQNDLPVPPRTSITPLLGTPRASSAKGSTAKQVEAGSPKARLEDQVQLFPTPISSDSKGTGPADTNRVTVQLRAINHLLPTVTTQESKTGPSQLNRNTPPLNAMIPEMHKEGINWGKYEPAVRRWEEVLGRKAPAPTNPDGKEGAHRLAAEFVEWMMGLPEGWVTDPSLGLKRNDQLKALGNGVVPQQAKLALQLLIDDEVLNKLGKK